MSTKAYNLCSSHNEYHFIDDSVDYRRTKQFVGLTWRRANTDISYTKASIMLYNPIQVVVACSQREKLKSQIQQKHLPVRIDLKNTTPTDTLLLTRGQIANIEKARALGKRKFKTIRMSRKQIEKN